MKALGIETSCDDTSIGLVSTDGQGFYEEALISYSQIKDHVPYGGVVPEVASRLHSEKIIKLLDEIGMDNIKSADMIAVTAYPGLPGALLVGINTAYMLGEFLDKPVIEVNHVYGHIFSILLGDQITQISRPLVVLTASGGHNEIYLIDTQKHSPALDHDTIILQGQKLHIMKLGKTLDDAAGECFDKTARMLGGPYPGGAWISARAAQGKSNPQVQFKRIFLKSDEFNFSFSGMKSKVYYLLQKLKEQGISLTDELINDICYEFQEAMIEMLAKKLIKAAQKYGAKTLAITGGVSANDALFAYTKDLATQRLHDTKVLVPSKKIYSTDNAAMIALVGLLLNNKK